MHSIQSVLIESLNYLKSSTRTPKTIPSTNNSPSYNILISVVFFIAHCERWTEKGRDWASALDFFEEITYRTDEWTRQLLRLKSWLISGNPEEWMEFRRLWWPVVVFKCGYFFHLFGFYCLLVQYLLFFEKLLFFSSLSLMTFEWQVDVYRKLLCKVTLP